jgi:hypothetical protein
MKKIKSVYVDWFAPRSSRGESFKPKKDWEIALIVRSTYFSREINDFSPVLYCDPTTEKYYRDLGIDECFDEIFSILPESVSDYNPGIFWAAGKFIAIDHCDSPFILMDLDLELRCEIDLSECELFCSHIESIDDNCHLFYPDPYILDENGYFKEKEIEFRNEALNTALLYFKDLDFAKEYSSLAFNYMKSIKETNPNLENNSYILLAEQRLLSELCRIKGISPQTLISGYYLPSKSVVGEKDPPFVDSNINEISKYFLHIWGYKSELNKNHFLEMDLYKKLLVSSPPDLQEIIENSTELNYNFDSHVQ